MAPPKVPKKPLKSMVKPIEKPITKTKKKKKNYDKFSIYIYKLLRTITTDQENIGISRNAMFIMNNFVSDMLEKIAADAGRLVAHGKKTTMGSQDIQTAIKLLIPGELATHANIEGLKAIRMYYKSQEQDRQSSFES